MGEVKNENIRDLQKRRPKDPIEEKEFREAAFKHIEEVFRSLDKWERESLSSPVRY
jgi:hypothetical protein